jgi:aldehyde dehydrogenase (NAD+)
MQLIEQPGNFINGAFAVASSGERLDVFAPSTGEQCGTVERSGAADVDAAVRSAASAQPAWAALRPRDRGRIMLRIAAHLREHALEFAEVEQRETGKAAAFVPNEIKASADYFEFYAGLGNVSSGEWIDLGDGYHSYTRREPYGVVGIITPWNGPLNQLCRGLAPALIAGNAVVSKPSEFTSGSALLLARVAVEHCGLPPGVLNVVTGLGPEAGTALVAHDLIRKVAFTGSVRAGREIGRIAADRIIPLTLELGGKSPNVIFEDADLAQAIPGALRGIFANSGQVCSAGSRLLVQRSIYDQVIAGLAEGAKAIRAGPGQGCMMGALTTRAQYERVRSFFQIAREDGARLVAGGPDVREEDWGSGWYLPLTIYADVRPDMRIAREEIFGPVLSVIAFETEDEAVAIANDTEYGLYSGLWTRDLSRAHRIAARLEAGTVAINEYGGDLELPFGGCKNSGYGREKGVIALDGFTHVKSVRIKL